jgi:hypothetical protein
MSRRHAVAHLLVASSIIAGTASAVTGTEPATAASSPADLAGALDLPSGVGASTTSDDSSAVGVSAQSFNDMPSRGSTYVVLSTGVASDLFSRTVPDDQPSTDLGASGPDRTTLVLTVDPSEAPRCLLVDFSMGTEERVHTYTADTASDTVSVTRDGDPAEHALNVGDSYISQPGYTPASAPYSVNAVNYWHSVGDPADPVVGTAEDPRLPAITPFADFTTRDTAEVPVPAGESSTVRVSVTDRGNGFLDTVALVDKVRLAPSCSYPALGMSPGSGIATGDAVIVGHRGVGNVLTLDPVRSTPAIETYDASANGWYPTPVEPRFRWFRNRYRGETYCYNNNLKAYWVPIPDADRQAYVPTNLDKDYCLMALETGVKDGYRSETYPTFGSQEWYVTLPIQDGTFDGTVPQVSGSPRVGSTLSALTADFTPRQDSMSYQWFADKVPLSGQTGSTLVVTAAEAGKSITIRATGRRSSFDDLTVSSPPFGPIELLTMDSAATPTITGDPAPGRAVTVQVGPWEPAPTSFAYQWRLDGQNIANAVTASYTPKASDLGRALSVQVVGAKSGYAPVSRISAPVTVGAAPMEGASPVLTGTPKVGATLTASVSGWQPAGSLLGYSWRVGGTEVAGATGRSFVIPPHAVGTSVTVTVRGTLAGYSPTARSTSTTVPVAAGTLVSPTPRVVGRPRVGRTVTASAAGWGPVAVTRSYRWLINGKAVKGTAASRARWKIPRSARGKRISVRVTGTSPGYTTAVRTSARTARTAR